MNDFIRISPTRLDVRSAHETVRLFAEDTSALSDQPLEEPDLIVEALE